MTSIGGYVGQYLHYTWKVNKLYKYVKLSGIPAVESWMNLINSAYPVVKTWTLISIPDGSFVLAWDDCLNDSLISFDNSISWIKFQGNNEDKLIMIVVHAHKFLKVGMLQDHPTILSKIRAVLTSKYPDLGLSNESKIIKS